MRPTAESLEGRTLEIGAQLYARTGAETPAVRSAHRWEFQVLGWCMADPALRTQVLRFIDCLPALHDAREVVRHLKEFFPHPSQRLPLALRLGLTAAGSGLPTAGVVAALTRHTASAIARLFLAGADLEDAAAGLRGLEERGFLLTCDLLGEATTSQAQADRYTESYLDLLSRWSRLLSTPPHVSLKLSSLAFPFDPVDPEGAWHQVHPRLRKILRAAGERGGFVNVDMEQYHLRDLTLNLVRRAVQAQFPATDQIGLVLQAYLKDAQHSAREILSWVKRDRLPLTIRLVRGAYWDSELLKAGQQNWPCPVYTEKSETDASFERLTDLLLEHHQHVRVAIATHNLRSIARAIAKAQALRVPQPRWEIQMLYGMSEPLQRAVLSLGIPVRIYAPIGALIPGMAYLVRRILENTSQYSFLAMGLSEEAPVRITPRRRVRGSAAITPPGCGSRRVLR